MTQDTVTSPQDEEFITKALAYVYIVVKDAKIPQLELDMIREFQRRVHHYMAHVPDMAKKDEWLALMRHHGVPARLLDFTYSPYVAAYVAFEHADPGTAVAVWAIDATWL
ncbi:MAG: FRG domain-containing protein [Chloroflexi bacterium]|nr:FRG domain-containing protein [Chloroflexota bacterium]